ncbi:MAG TPA: hypothetical protein VEI04_02745 [Syntrophobacteria bacterium]|nr:hypothetical protein [Syntrophobacteria bacterium]
MTDWLPQNPEIKHLTASCALPRLAGALSGVVVELFEVEAKAKAHYLLASVRKDDCDNKGRHATGG